MSVEEFPGNSESTNRGRDNLSRQPAPPLMPYFTLSANSVRFPSEPVVSPLPPHKINKLSCLRQVFVYFQVKDKLSCLSHSFYLLLNLSINKIIMFRSFQQINTIKVRETPRQLEESVGKTVFGHFAKLSAAMGVEDIHKRERDWRRGRDLALMKEGEVSQQLGSVRAEIAMLDQTLQECAARDPQKEAADCEAEIAALQGQHERLAASSAELRDEAERLAAQLEARRKEENAMEQEVALRRTEAREEQQRLAEADRRLATFSAELQAVRDSRADLLRRSVLEDIEVPVVGGDGAEELAVDLSALPQERHIYIYICRQRETCMYVYIYIYIYTYVYMYVYIYIYIGTYIYIYICIDR